MSKLSGYTKSISEATKVTDPYELQLIEEVMRCDRPTLDNVRQPEFNKLARLSAEALKDPELRQIMEESYPRS